MKVHAAHAKKKVDEFVRFIVARHAVYTQRQKGAKKPWTQDPILQKYRFCNVYRELDTVTKWIANNWRTPNHKDKNLWFAMVIARLVNWPKTLDRMTYKVASPKWNTILFQHVIRDMRDCGEKAYSGAYIVSTNGRKMLKEKYLAEQVLTPLWEARATVCPKDGDTLRAFYERLAGFQGMGSFMAAQVVADIKYVLPLRKAKDWWTFAASGPGSRRGLNRIAGRGVDDPWGEAVWYEALCALAGAVNPQLLEKGMSKLHNQDLQNCLCEFDKYERVRLGQGTPRANYPGV